MLFDRATLLSHGFVAARTAALDIVEYALAAVDPLEAFMQQVRLDGPVMTVQGDAFDLDTFESVYVIGAGKATYHQAVALERLLGERISDGFIAIKAGQLEPFVASVGELRRIRVAEAAHPVPDESSAAAGREVIALAERAGRRDLVVCLMSGGVSAQCICPARGLSIADKTVMNRLLVTSGADITEIMTVRRHLSQIKGGRLALKMYPATVLALTVSDEKSDAMGWNTDWTSTDATTPADARRILEKYRLWERTPVDVRAHLDESAREVEGPVSIAHVNIHNHMTVKTSHLGEAAMRRARELGLTPLLLTSVLSGESREVGRTLACIAREVALSDRPAAAPCALIATGETSVRIVGEPTGSGGANQELAAGACLELRPDEPIAVCAMDTDGSDGPGAAAGSLVDGATLEMAAGAGHDLHDALVAHDVGTALFAVGDLVITGPTGTNVNDLVVAVVLGAAR